MLDSIWKAAIDAAVERTLTQINDKCNEIAWFFFNSVVELSPKPGEAPYSLGVLINQWYPADGTFSIAYSTSRSSDGSGSKARLSNFFSRGKYFYGKDGKVTFTNNSPYADLAETTGWLESINPIWKNAKPYRMVARSLQKTVSKYRKR